MTSVCRTAAIAALIALVSPAAALAQSERTTGHPVETIWPSAVRFLRIDQGYEIVDKDADAGYILFEYEQEDRRFRGSLELVATRGAQGQPELRLVCTLTNRPSYLEEMLLERLMDKIHAEHGDPPPAKKPAPRKPKPGGGDKPGDKAPDKPKRPAKPAESPRP